VSDLYATLTPGYTMINCHGSLRERLITASNEPALEAAPPTGTVSEMYICGNGFAIIYPDKNSQTPICVAYVEANKL
jgi:hypothetical protein